MDFEQHLFISDVHLGAFSATTNQQIEGDLIALIEHCKEERIEINILGDLFDYWMEYPEKGFVPDLGKKVLDAFEEYNNTVSPALFITGNHDNWTFGHFKERGFDLESNFRLKEIDGKRLLLLHGDGVAAAKIDFPGQRFINCYETINLYVLTKDLIAGSGIGNYEGLFILHPAKRQSQPRALEPASQKDLQQA